MFQTERNKYFKYTLIGLKIPTGGKHISWPIYKYDKEVELGSTEKQLQLSAQSRTRPHDQQLISPCNHYI